ncbi:MAG: hypothetical protein J1F63_03865 [Oscillospiraceae bacterium]|nr:hypothetical protein [Oscillospiraceae bacterium]
MHSYTADEIFAIFSRVFGGLKRPFTLHSRTLSGRIVYRRSCHSCRSVAAGRADCAHCRGGSYSALTAESVLNHINGGAAVGIYPADENGLCRFSVLELGGPAPAVALRYLRDACCSIGVSCLCEICGHGESARLWIFFGTGLSPQAALYSAMRVISEAFSENINGAGAITDILPVVGNGFGRPAVLPLFDISDNFSFLLNDDFEPVADPIALLSDLAPSSADFSFPEYSVPPEIKAELCGSLYINTAGLPPQTLASLCRGACFVNSMMAEFSGEPSIVRCFELSGGRLAVPRGFDISALLPGTKISLTDSRTSGRKLRLKYTASLTGWQKEAFKALIDSGSGILTAPTGSGKTAIILALLAKLGRSTLILTPDRVTAVRWQRRICDHMGIKENAVGLIAEDKDWPNGLFDIAVLGPNTALRLAEHLPSYGVVFVADCDRMQGGAAFRECMETVCARYIYACSARPTEQARLADYLRLYIGKTVFSLN